MKMQDSNVNYFNKGQIKIQQMAFVLVALMIFFSLAALIYFAIYSSNIKETSIRLKQQEALEITRKLQGTPEFTFSQASDCSSCIDFDKVLLLKNRPSYNNFWNLNYLMIEKISPPTPGGECTKTNYPNCNQTTIIPAKGDIETQSAFITLVRWVPEGSSGYYKYEFGKIHTSSLNQNVQE